MLYDTGALCRKREGIVLKMRQIGRGLYIAWYSSFTLCERGSQALHKLSLAALSRMP
jgi:hypothetical protein